MGSPIKILINRMMIMMMMMMMMTIIMLLLWANSLHYDIINMGRPKINRMMMMMMMMTKTIMMTRQRNVWF